MKTDKGNNGLDRPLPYAGLAVWFFTKPEMFRNEKVSCAKVKPLENEQHLLYYYVF